MNTTLIVALFCTASLVLLNARVQPGERYSKEPGGLAAADSGKGAPRERKQQNS